MKKRQAEGTAESVTIDDVIALLNRVMAADDYAAERAFLSTCEAEPGLELIPGVQIIRDPSCGAAPQVNALGILNALFTEDSISVRGRMFCRRSSLATAPARKSR